MKKPKVSFDTKKLQQFFILHVEKIAAAVMVAVLLYLVYGAIMHETYEKTASDLQQKSQQAEANITTATWGSEQAAELEITDYEAQAERVRAPIGEADDSRVVLNAWLPFNPPVINLLTKRKAPQLLPVEELEVASGYGPIAVAGGGARIGNREGAEPAGGQRVRGLRWASVVGLVPYDEQKRKYDAVFRNAHEWDAGRDVPNYEGFLVYRAEVTTGNEDEELQWERVFWTQGAPKRDWAKSDEVVPREFILEPLCDPLPPLLDRRWGASVSHSKIPIISQADDVPEEAAAAEEGAVADPEPFFPDRPAAQPTKKNEPAKTEKKPAPPHRLFRFLDYKVEPGKRYRYRVRLAIRNPNYELPARYLEDPALAQRPWLFVDSAPSPVVSIPRSDDVLLGRASPASGPNEESANVILTHFDENTGSTAPHEHKLFRGQVANVVVPTMNVMNPMDNRAEQLTDVRIKSDIMLLDVVGGDRLPLDRGTADEPGEMLVLDPSFRLIRRTQMEDQEEFEAAKELLERVQGGGEPKRPEERRGSIFGAR